MIVHTGKITITTQMVDELRNFMRVSKKVVEDATIHLPDPQEEVTRRVTLCALQLEFAAFELKPCEECGDHYEASALKHFKSPPDMLNHIHEADVCNRCFVKLTNWKIHDDIVDAGPFSSNLPPLAPNCRSVLKPVLALALACLGTGCTPAPSSPSRPPLVVPGGSPDACQLYCGKAVELRCPEASGSPGEDEIEGNADDVPCLQVCRDVIAGGHYQSRRECIEQATSCHVAENCLLGE